MITDYGIEGEEIDTQNTISFSFVANLDAPKRVDLFLVEHCASITSRSQVKNRLIDVFINDQPAKLSARLVDGDRVKGNLQNIDIQTGLIPEKLNAAVIFENNDVLVVCKPHGMVVHPGNGNHSGTLLHGIAGYISGLQNAFEGAEEDIQQRPGIVHRLDKDTSGVIITAKHPTAHAQLSHQFAQRMVGKLYLAVVHGRPPHVRGRIEARLARDPKNRKRFAVTQSMRIGKSAATRYLTVCSNQNYSLVALYPETGRTHQLRVHMQHVGCPILGDPLYSRKKTSFVQERLMLHSALLRISCPGEEQYRSLFAAPGKDWQRIFIEALPDCLLDRDSEFPEDMDWYESQLQQLMADRWPEK